MGERGFGLKKALEYSRHAEECRVLARAAQNVEHEISCSLLNIGVLLACAKRALIDEGIEAQDKMDKADHYRVRTQEMRRIAEGIFDPKERKTLMDIALEYEELSLRRDVRDGYPEMENGLPPRRPNGADHKSRGNSN